MEELEEELLPAVFGSPRGCSSLRLGLLQDLFMADGAYLSLSCTVNLQTLEMRTQSGSVGKGLGAKHMPT